MTLREADNYINKINKQLVQILKFNGSITNPLLTPYTNALRALNMDYRFKNGKIIISRKKENLNKVEKFDERLQRNHAMSVSQYRKHVKEQLTETLGRVPTGAEIDKELIAKRAVWNMKDNFEILYSYTRTGSALPKELKRVQNLPKIMKRSRDMTTEEIKKYAVKLEQAMLDYSISESESAMKYVKRGDAL